MDCRHSNIECDKAEKVYRCKDCRKVVGHFAVFATPEPPKGTVSIGNGLYARTRGK